MRDFVSANLFSEAAALQGWCLAQGWRFCFIGGLAVQHWGRPRVTDDIDLTLLTGFGGEERFAEALIRLDGCRFDHRAPAGETRLGLHLFAAGAVGGAEGGAGAGRAIARTGDEAARRETGVILVRV